MPSAAKYLEQREDDGTAVRGNREKAMLSHCFTKVMTIVLSNGTSSTSFFCGISPS